MWSLLRQYHEQLPERVGEIRAAVEANDSNRLARLAHNLKGVSLNFSADLLANFALGLEETAKRDDLSKAHNLVSQLELEALRLSEFLLVHRR